MRYVVYTKATGEILKIGTTRNISAKVTGTGRAILPVPEGQIIDDEKHKVSDGKIVIKPMSELPNPRPVIPIEDRPAAITNRQWNDILSRIQRIERSIT